MTLPPLSRALSRRVDELAVSRYGISSLVLMENAGRGVADVLSNLGIDGTVVLCCGKGNNAGDGFVVARHLDLRGHAVRILLWSTPEQLSPDAAANFQIARKLGLPIEPFDAQHDPARLETSLSDATWIVDALLGTGARGEPRPPLDQVIDQLNAHSAAKLSIDIPSGLDCDTGQAARHTFRADHTCTLFASKTGFFTPTATQYIGQLHTLDIGIRDGVHFRENA